MKQVDDNVKTVRSITKQHRSGDFEFAIGIEEQKKLWSARKEALWSMLALREEGSDVWSTDVAVPLSRLPDIIGESSRNNPPPATRRPSAAHLHLAILLPTPAAPPLVFRR